MGPDGLDVVTYDQNLGTYGKTATLVQNSE